jgi:hypothetical protein
MLLHVFDLLGDEIIAESQYGYSSGFEIDDGFIAGIGKSDLFNMLIHVVTPRIIYLIIWCLIVI